MRRFGVWLLRISKALLGSLLGVAGGITTFFQVMAGFCAFVLSSVLIGGFIAFLVVYPQFSETRAKSYDILAKVDRSDFRALSDTEVYDNADNLLGIVNAGHFEYVEIKDISLNIQNAYIAQEDRKFKEHIGIDAMAIARAGLALVKHDGRITQGGSTITQQVIKNTYLTQEQTFKRKIIEIMLAPEIEKKFSKADIMEFYCNTNYYGNHCYGVESASKYYFGKNAKDLSIWEAATLVGISNSPSKYDPVKHVADSKDKRNQVLASMKEVGFIDDKAYTDAVGQDLVVLQQTQESTNENYQVSYAIHCASIELMKLDGFEFKYTFDSKDEYDSYMQKYSEKYKECSDKVRSGGYKIYTTLDSGIQNQVQGSIDTGLAQFTELQDNGKYAMQGSAVVVDNKTHYVVAIVGGRGTEDQFNRAYLSARQPGSAIKPLLDYGPALDTGEYYPSKVINDHKWDNGPSNSSNSYRGNVTIREALNRSLNTVAWQLLQGVGVKNGMEYLGKMRFQKLSYIDSAVEAVSIGGFTNGVRVVDMAKGYSTLANGGVYSDRTCMRALEYQNQGDLLRMEKEKTEQVYLEDTAYMVTDMLKGTITESYGTGRGLGLSTGMPVAGKTGTTNSSKDTWFCGYSPYYSIAVWVGYDTPRSMPGVYGATYAGKIWQSAMEQINTGKEIIDWAVPYTVEACNYKPSDGTKVDYTTGHVDLFSNTAEIRAKQAEYEKGQQELADRLGVEVSKFEAFQIVSVEDTYKIKDMQSSLLASISKLDDNSLKKPLIDRVESKYESLISVVSGMTEQIKLYETNKVAQMEQMEKQKALEAEQARIKQANELKIADFTTALNKLTELKYNSAEIEQLTATAREKLKELSDLSDYDKYYKQLELAMKQLNNLPDKATWEKQQAKAQEEESIAESKRTAEAESKAQANDQALQDILKKPAKSADVTSDSTEYGPGMQ